MKVTTDACLFGAWMSRELSHLNHEITNALDIGSGTGLLSLMLAQQHSCHIDAIEIDQSAYEQSVMNIKESLWAHRLNVRHISMHSFVPVKTYDFIFSNPPFYERDLRSPDGRKNHAMHDTGLSVSDIIEFMDIHLASDGVAALLMPARRKEDVLRILTEKSFKICKITSVCNSMNHPELRIMFFFSKNKTASVCHEKILIKSDNGEYSSEFKELLKTYYLYF